MCLVKGQIVQICLWIIFKEKKFLLAHSGLVVVLEVAGIMVQPRMPLTWDQCLISLAHVQSPVCYLDKMINLLINSSNLHLLTLFIIGWLLCCFNLYLFSFLYKCALSFFLFMFLPFFVLSPPALLFFFQLLLCLLQSPFCLFQCFLLLLSLCYSPVTLSPLYFYFESYSLNKWIFFENLNLSRYGSHTTQSVKEEYAMAPSSSCAVLLKTLWGCGMKPLGWPNCSWKTSVAHLEASLHQTLWWRCHWVRHTTLQCSVIHASLHGTWKVGHVKISSCTEGWWSG